MFHRMNFILVLALGCSSALAAEPGYQPGFHPDQLKGPPAGTPNRVLVLGSPHLAELSTRFEPEHIEPLLLRLAAWRPDAIAIEAVPGLQCDFMRRSSSRYADSVDSYCVDTAPAERATGLDVPAANAEAERLLAAWPAAPSPAQRRHLAAILLAAGERHSALVQWLRLPANERIAADGLDDALAAYLSSQSQRRGESAAIAAVLAARLGLERVWAVDDHTADSPTPDHERTAAARALGLAWDNEDVRARAAADVPLYANLREPGGMLALYRAYNAPSSAMVAYRGDFGAALREPSAEGYGRRYLGYWETRNLRMVANIRDVLARKPGTRMLALVGASHKGYYEAYLHQMHDVQLVDSSDVLR